MHVYNPENCQNKKELWSLATYYYKHVKILKFGIPILLFALGMNVQYRPFLYNDVKRGKKLNAMSQGQFLATIRNANDVFMKFIGSPTTCPVPWDIA